MVLGVPISLIETVNVAVPTELFVETSCMSKYICKARFAVELTSNPRGTEKTSMERSEVEAMQVALQQTKVVHNISSSKNRYSTCRFFHQSNLLRGSFYCHRHQSKRPIAPHFFGSHSFLF